MATNFVQDGDVLSLVAPSGGVVSGSMYAIDQLVVIAGVTAAVGATFNGHTRGVWTVPCGAGLLAGAKVSLLTGALVADGTALSVPCGKLATDEAGGFAKLMLRN